MDMMTQKLVTGRCMSKRYRCTFVHNFADCFSKLFHRETSAVNLQQSHHLWSIPTAP